MRNCILVIGVSLVVAPMAHASETITYTYDAKGRLIKVEHSGSVNNNLKTEYTHDRVDNRKKVKVTGSPNPPPP